MVYRISCQPSENVKFHFRLDHKPGNRPRSIYQYSNVAPRLSGQTSIFGVVSFVSKCPLGIERQKSLKKFTILTRKPWSHVKILIYRTWPIKTWDYSGCDAKTTYLS